MKKKAMALLLTAAMAASVLTGCGSGDGGSGSQASGSQGGRTTVRQQPTMESTIRTRTGTSTRSSTTSS